MAVETDDDRSYMLADFGVTVSYTLTGSSAKNITCIFDNDVQEIDAGGAVTFAVEVPRLLCRTSDIATAAEGDTAVISATTYSVLSVFRDGQGMTELRLEKQ
jgi:hypothetical protein